MKTFTEISAMSAIELRHMLLDLNKEYALLRLRSETVETSDSTAKRKLRRTIARVKTVMSQKGKNHVGE